MKDTERKRDLEGVRLPSGGSYSSSDVDTITIDGDVEITGNPYPPVNGISVKDWGTMHYHVEEGYSTSAPVTVARCILPLSIVRIDLTSQAPSSSSP